VKLSNRVSLSYIPVFTEFDSSMDVAEFVSCLFCLLDGNFNSTTVQHNSCYCLYVDSENDKKSSVDQAFRDELLHLLVSFYVVM